MMKGGFVCAESLYVQVNVIVKAVGSLRVLYQVLLLMSNDTRG